MLCTVCAEVNYTIVVDDRGVQGLQERVFFEETNNSMINSLETLSQGVEECFTWRVFVRVRTKLLNTIHLWKCLDLHVYILYSLIYLLNDSIHI